MARTSRGRAPRRRPGILVLVVLLLVAGVLVWRTAYQRASGVDVYFIRFDAAHHKGSLVAVRRPAPRGPVEARLRAALRALLDGPGGARQQNGQEVGTEIPVGTALLDAQVSRGIATVNLSRTYASGGGSSSMLARVWQIVYTATQFPDTPAVQILIEGRRTDALGGEGIVIGAPLRRPSEPPVF